MAYSCCRSNRRRWVWTSLSGGRAHGRERIYNVELLLNILEYNRLLVRYFLPNAQRHQVAETQPVDRPSRRGFQGPRKP